MTQTTAYSVDAFIDDVREIFDTTQDALAQASGVAERMERLLTTPGLNLRLMNLPSYSPDFNADEAIWGWVCEDATANLCPGTRIAVREKVGGFFADPAHSREEVKRRCQTVLQARAAELTLPVQAHPYDPTNVDFTLASV